jgi:hypothetical protein
MSATYDQIKSRARLVWGESQEHSGFACWYPQMGGYAGKCVSKGKVTVSPLSYGTTENSRSPMRIATDQWCFTIAAPASLLDFGELVAQLLFDVPR